jgi:ABC-type multidrug transport system fused ATPase/permease subunit
VGEVTAIERAVLRRGFGVLWRAVREEPRVFVVAAVGSAIYGMMTVAMASVIGAVTDRVIVPAFATGQTTPGALAAAAAAVIGVGMVKSASVLARRLGAGVMQYRLQATYRRRVTRQYLRLPLAWHHQHSTGQLLSNANADVEATWYVLAPFPLAVGVLIMLAVAGAAMFSVDVLLALVGSLVFPAIFVLNLAYQRRLSPVATRAQQLRADLSGTAHESFEAALVVKTLGREADETARFGAEAVALREANVRVGRLRALFDPVLEALPSLGVLAVLAVGAWRLDRGTLVPGELVQVAYLFMVIAFPVRAIGWLLGELPRSVVGWDRVSRVLDATGETVYGPRRLPRAAAPAGLGVEGVDFGYDGSAVLHGVTFDVPAGRTIAVVGPTGSGKSTLASLLVRLVDPATGAVLVDGIDLRAVRRGEVAGAVAIVPQQAFLFDDTVRGNVTLGLEVPDAAVWEALSVAQADRFVAALPDGLGTRVGERGTSLSGGQRQRIALARALVRKPRLLVLDDATSSVDPLVEARILSGLRAARDRVTAVVVAYRTATIALADEVVYIEHGRVLDRGGHRELLDRSEHYRALVRAYEREQAERLARAEDDETEVA